MHRRLDLPPPRGLAALHRRARVLACLAPVALMACGSTDGARDEDRPKQAFDMEDLDLVAIQGEEMPIGEFLSKADLAMRAWTRLTHTASTPAERTQARQLEEFLSNETTNRREELVIQLEVGPLFNRMRAASALGFTDVESLSPLLAALSDPAPDVVHNALLGLALLAEPDTPLGGICQLMRESPDAHVRSNAAYALRSILEAGGDGECAVDAGRTGLHDEEPLVRVQAALVLGLEADAESIPAITDQIYDETPLVSRAAVQSLALIAAEDRTQRGSVARALLVASEKAPRPNRPAARAALVRLAGVDHGDYESWLKWAHGLP